ncbi:MAG: hypothetical protein Q4F30_08870 [Akkermansia sp.]|nr:hypothetical protein [Akkermansia sp.]
MKKLWIPVLAAMMAMPMEAVVKTYWVKGVSETEGWYDADKNGGGESELCWAASAANMLAWWQDRNKETAGKTEAPTGKEVWELMRKAMHNRPGSPQGGVNWWFSHSLQPGPMGGADNGKGAFYESVRGGKGVETLLLRAPKFDTDLTFSERVKELIQTGSAIAVAIQPLQGKSMMPGTHWISLWGIDFDEDKKVITRVYVTDSDDATGNWPSIQKGLFAADCTWAEDVNANGRIFSSLIFKTPQGWYNDNTCITSLVTLNCNSEFITDGDKEANAKEAEEQDAKEAKSVAKKGKKLAKPKKDKGADKEAKAKEKAAKAEAKAKEKEEKKAAKKKKK